MMLTTTGLAGWNAMLAPALAAAEGGFNPLDVAQGGSFLWTLIIFAIAAPFIWKVVMGPVTRALAERDGKAEQAIIEAQKASAAAEQARAEVEVHLGQARAEAANLMAAARDRAALREGELIDAAKTEAQNLLDGARRAIQAEERKAIAAIRDEVVELAMSGAKRVLARNVGGEDDRRLVADLIGQVKTAPGKPK
jgi:F-type H+-transporting ATPase subunit b